jgi:hypothetical protein
MLALFTPHTHARARTCSRARLRRAASLRSAVISCTAAAASVSSLRESCAGVALRLQNGALCCKLVHYVAKWCTTLQAGALRCGLGRIACQCASPAPAAHRTAFVYACVRACVCVHVCASVHAWVCVRGCVGGCVRGCVCVRGYAPAALLPAWQSTARCAAQASAPAAQAIRADHASTIIVRVRVVPCVCVSVDRRGLLLRLCVCARARGCGHVCACGRECVRSCARVWRASAAAQRADRIPIA